LRISKEKLFSVDSKASLRCIRHLREVCKKEGEKKNKKIKKRYGKWEIPQPIRKQSSKKQTRVNLKIEHTS
jgi:hypothetical protein